jgi:hypothetical protein
VPEEDVAELQDLILAKLSWQNSNIAV